MNEIINTKKEFTIHCPHYTKNLKSCPSSKKVIFPEDLEKLEKSCLSESYKGCAIYRELNEKAA